ncbi:MULTISPECIES: acetolactate synthase small subunit [Saliphagus]|uniref:Acetolactate synthase small subunit n=1 Tax=Saliphagus infecundisoli TaxID=1849069 RepID=A0ABD5QK10_9EURY|nr:MULTISPECIES: acetolactate synthase small subunit [Saliphagus]
MTQGLEGPRPEERPRPEGRRNAQGIRIDPEVEAEPAVRRTVISALVTHEPGVLSDVSGLFSRRQFNIESLTVGPTEDEERARITLVIEEHEPGIEQAKKQLRKLVPVISVRELEPDAMRRELMLIKVSATRPDRVAAVTEMYDGKTVDATPETATIQVTGSRQKVEAAVEAFSQFGIREISRTGTTALARGDDRTAAREESPVEYEADGTPTTPQTTHSDDD